MSLLDGYGIILDELAAAYIRASLAHDIAEKRRLNARMGLFIALRSQLL